MGVSVFVDCAYIMYGGSRVGVVEMIMIRPICADVYRDGLRHGGFDYLLYTADMGTGWTYVFCDCWRKGECCAGRPDCAKTEDEAGCGFCEAWI